MADTIPARFPSSTSIPFSGAVLGSSVEGAETDVFRKNGCDLAGEAGNGSMNQGDFTLLYRLFPARIE